MRDLPAIQDRIPQILRFQTILLAIGGRVYQVANETDYMKNSFLLLSVASLFAVPDQVNAASTVSVSFWGYDEAAGSTPYYSHYSVTRDTSPNFWNGGGTAETIAIVNLLDSGWGYSTAPWTWSSYHVFTAIDAVGSIDEPLRSIGWHEYEFSFNTLTNTASILMDGTAIQTGAYTGPLNYFSFNYNGYSGESVIDDFSVKYDGLTVYEQNFESYLTDLLGSGWAVSRQEIGGYVESADPSNPHSGNGALALGGAVSGIVFDLNSIEVSAVPEPGNFLSLAGLVGSAMFLRSRRKSAKSIA
jgi:hypothetical protein